MKTLVKKIEALKVPLDAKPGALSQVFGAFKDAGVEVNASWGHDMRDGKAEAWLYPNDVRRAEEILMKLGKKPLKTNACYVEGDNHTGVYFDLLSRIEKAGINISTTDAIGLNGKFASIIYTEEKDFPRLVKVLDT